MICSVYVSTVFDTSQLVQQYENFFSPGEYLLCESGFALQPFMSVLYRHNNTPHNHILPPASTPHNQFYRVSLVRQMHDCTR